MGSGAILYGWRFWSAWQELRGSIFELEQINAQRRLNQSAIAIFILVVMGFVVFSLVTFISPVITPEYVLGEPPIQQATELVSSGGRVETTSPDNPDVITVLSTATPLPTVVINTENCKTGIIEITSPQADQEVLGVITVEGVVNVENFGFYKFELAQAHEEIWKPIQVFKSLVTEEGPLYERLGHIDLASRILRNSNRCN